jgi:transcription elongation factor GreA
MNLTTKAPANTPRQIPKVPVSSERLAQMRAELSNLVSKERPHVIERIKVARAHGDLKENSEYKQAREDQSFLEGKIATLEYNIEHSHVFQKAKTGKVGLGSKVKIRDDMGDAEYTVVGSSESNPTQGNISVDSPLGKLLMSSSSGDKLRLKAPQGERQIEVLGVD